MNRSSLWRRLLAALFVLTLVAAACSDDDGGDADDAAPADTGGGADADAPGDDADADGGEDDSSGEPESPSDDDGPAEDDGGGEAPAGDPEATTGFDGETITLGFLTDQSGPLAILGVPLAAGSQAYWDYVNEELGGVGGRYRVELELGDTKDDSATAVQEYQKLKDDVVLIAEVLSTPPTQAVLEFLKEDGMVAVPGSLAGVWANEINLLPAGSAYDFEMINIADWFVNDSGLGDASSVACVVSVDDLYGQSTLGALEYAAGELGFELAVKETIQRTQTDFSAVVASLDGAGCEAVYAITVPSEQHALMAESLSQGFEPIWLGALPSYLNLLAGTAPERYANFYVALDTPGFDATDVVGMANFLDRWGTYGDGDPNTFHLSGYFQQIAVHALLEKAVELGDLSREGVLAARAQLGEVELDGLADNYVYGTPGDDQDPASASRIFVFDPEAPPNLLSELAEVDSELNAGYEL